MRTLATSTWCTPPVPPPPPLPATPCSRARVRLLERACAGGWGKPSSAKRCRSAGWPEKKRCSNRCRSPPSVPSDFSSSSLLSNLQLHHPWCTNHEHCCLCHIMWSCAELLQSASAPNKNTWLNHVACLYGDMVCLQHVAAAFSM